jgi:hypothetical protein
METARCLPCVHEFKILTVEHAMQGAPASMLFILTTTLFDSMNLGLANPVLPRLLQALTGASPSEPGHLFGLLLGANSTMLSRASRSPIPGDLPPLLRGALATKQSIARRTGLRIASLTERRLDQIGHTDDNRIFRWVCSDDRFQTARDALRVQRRLQHRLSGTG